MRTPRDQEVAAVRRTAVTQSSPEVGRTPCRPREEVPGSVRGKMGNSLCCGFQGKEWVRPEAG